jgi:hypothetical protein
MLRLEVLDFEGPAAWRWRLTDDDGGRFLADAQVRLDSGAWQFEAFGDLDDYLRWNAAPDRRTESEKELVAGVGAWIGECVFGDVGRAMVKRAPVTVRVEVPAEAEVLAYRPLELAWVDGQPIGAQDVSMVIDMAGAERRPSASIGDRLRMLAVFSLPVDASALNLRRERVELARLIDGIAVTRGKAVELRVVQYGVTRERLEDLMLEDEGWDVVHISGHGLPAGLLLERDDGHHDLISSGELVRLLGPVAQQLKLVVLSSCESAALTAAEHLRLLGIAPGSAGPGGQSAVSAPRGSGNGAGGNGNAAEALPALAAALAGRLDCAVLAMRYPVADEFAIALARRVYDLVLGKGQPLARALALTMPRVLDEPRMAAAPAISVATPALFGVRAAELRLQLPAGGPVRFEIERQKLAQFPPQPERFVGRVGPMSNATAAMAVDNPHSGVLFHGMAGAGKTACALELAYTHEQSFERLVWHEAPKESEDLAPSLTRLALDFEDQLEGVRMVHLVDDVDALRRFLPRLSDFLRRQRVLIVLDNCESLLTSAGDWRDERWGLVVDALAGHGGFSRLVMTSRTLPRALAPDIRVEAVHALTIHEAVLLAREWPHLRALMDGTVAGVERDDARDLAARTLASVQGHPKLIELADGQATRPDELRVSLARAEQAWAGAGVKPDEFLEQGQSVASDTDYLHVLDHWTRGTAAQLPEASQLLFKVLCCIEPEDRAEPIVRDNWADIWRRLGRSDEPPDVETAVAPLSEHALVAVDRDAEGTARAYHMHPAVASAGRADSDPELRDAVDFEIAAYWVTALETGLERETEQLGWLVLRAASGGLPYFLRQQAWATLTWTAGTVLTRDVSPRTAAGLLPLLRQAATIAGDTENELEIRREAARALEVLRPAEATAEYRALLQQAEEGQNFRVAGVIAGDLIRLLYGAGRLEEVLQLCEAMQDYHRRAGLGPWTQLAGEGQRLQILSSMGQAQQVLDRVQELRPRIAELPDESDERETATPFNVREVLLDIGRSAAQALRRWEDALALNTEQLKSMQGRDAPVLDIARAAFNDYFSLLRLGRIDEARTLLLRCRQTFDDEHDLQGLGKTLTALADVEDELGRSDQAFRVEADALRIKYAVGQPESIRVSHANRGYYIKRNGGDSREAAAHLLAAAIIHYQMSSGGLAESLRRVASGVQSMTPATAIEWDELCELVARTEGVELAELVAQLPTKAADGPGALAEVLRQAGEMPSEEVHDLDRHLANWEPVLSALIAARAGDREAAALLEEALTARAERSDWNALADVLRRVASGEQGDELLAGLDPIDTAITQRALDALRGRTAIEAEAWRSLAAPPDDAMEGLREFLAGLAATVVAAARGRAGAAEALQPALDELARHEQWAALAGVVRRIVAGERGESLIDGLDTPGAAVVQTILTMLEYGSDPDEAEER